MTHNGDFNDSDQSLDALVKVVGFLFQNTALDIYEVYMPNIPLLHYMCNKIINIAHFNREKMFSLPFFF